MTELVSVTSLTVESSGATLTSVEISTGDLGTDCGDGEAYEGVLVTVSDVTATEDASSYGEIPIDDGSGEAQLEDGLLDTDT